MKQIQFILIITCMALVSFVSSCKKKDSTAPATSGGGGTTGGLITNGIYGNMQVGYMDTDYGSGSVVRDSSAVAFFYESPVSTSISPSIYAGTVTVNGSSLNYNSTNNYYSRPVDSSAIQTLTWIATGSGTVVPFSYSYTPLYPTITSPVNLPDTSYKASGVTVNLSGIGNSSTGARVYLMQGSNMLNKAIYNSGGSVTFSAGELSAFSTNTYLYIEIILDNISQQTVGGVKYQFTSNYTYLKHGYLK